MTGAGTSPHAGPGDAVSAEAEVVRVVADPAAAADAAAAHVARTLAAAASERGRADWATTGGSTPAGIYDRLAQAPLVDAIRWDAVHVWWGDDRYVAPDDAHSNVRPLREHLVGAGVSLPAANVHPMRGLPSGESDVTIDAAAAASAEELLEAGPAAPDGIPVFDLVLLGVGPDGHILSVFPGSSAFASSELVLPIAAPTHVEPHVERLTMRPGVVGAARGVLAVVTGEPKAAVLRDVLGPTREPIKWPAQLARRAGATWIVDAAAAGIRRAEAGDAEAVADVWLGAFRDALPFPPAHPDEDARRWLAGQLTDHGREAWVALDGEGAVVAMMILGASTVEQLYVTPAEQRRGIGSRLLSLAKHRRPAGLELYTFQVNEGARRFYARHGFVEVRSGDGSRNEERQPDVLLGWQPQPDDRPGDA